MEKIPHQEIISEGELSRLRKELEMAEAELAEIKEERDQKIASIVAGEKGSAHNFNDYLRRVKNAEQKAIVALEAWGNAAAKFYKLED